MKSNFLAIIQATGPNVTLSLPVQKSTHLNNLEPAGNLDITLPKTEIKEFYRLILPQ